MRKTLITNADGNREWIEIGYGAEIKPSRELNAQGEDLTVDGYINKYGGIESAVDGKVYTSKYGYNEHLKANNCHIKDY